MGKTSGYIEGGAPAGILKKSENLFFIFFFFLYFDSVIVDVQLLST